MGSFPRQAWLASRWRAWGPRGFAVLFQKRLFAPPSPFLFGQMNSRPGPVSVSVRRALQRSTEAWQDSRSTLLPGLPGSVRRNFNDPDTGVVDGVFSITRVHAELRQDRGNARLAKI